MYIVHLPFAILVSEKTKILKVLDILFGAFPTKIARIDLVPETINTVSVSTCRCHHISVSYQLCGLFREPVYPRWPRVAYTRYSIAYGCGLQTTSGNLDCFVTFKSGRSACPISIARIHKWLVELSVNRSTVAGYGRAIHRKLYQSLKVL